MKFTKHTIYIGLFAILYLIVAFSSFWHACAFFGLANNTWMSIILALAFEVGQAAVLFSLLTSEKDRGRIMPWVLMTMFTLVQIVGNVFSSYKYIITNSVENLRYFKEPIFIWTDLPDQEATVIVTYVVGAILPVASLLLTSMITNYLTDIEKSKNDDLEIGEEVPDKLIEDNNVENDNSQLDDLNNQLKEKEEKIQKISEEHDKLIDEKFEKEQQLQNALEATEEMNKSLVEKSDEIQELKEKLKVHEENPLINEHSILQMENQGLTESNKKKDEEIDNLKKQLEELKHPKIPQIPVNEINNVIPFSEPKELKETKQNEEDLKMASDLMSGNIFEKQRVNKESHFINNDEK